MRQGAPAHKRPTVKDVAELAGVAVSSVSRVFTDHDDVSEAMRERVQRAAEELGYRPNLIARGLRRGETGTVGFLVRDISNPLFAGIMVGAESRLGESGLAVLLADAGGGTMSDAEYIDLLVTRQVDGIILSLRSETDPATLERLRQVSIPVVLLDRELPDLQFSAVLCDHYTGMRDAVRNVLNHGHQHVALVIGTTEIRATRERIRGYRDAHREFGVALDDRLVFASSYRESFGYEKTHEIMEEGLATALVAGGTQLTVGALRSLHDGGYQVGHDISFVACDDVPWLSFSNPPIDVVSRSAHDIGALAAELLVEAGDDGGSTRVVPLATTYIKRGSVMPRGHQS